MDNKHGGVGHIQGNAHGKGGGGNAKDGNDPGNFKSQAGSTVKNVSGDADFHKGGSSKKSSGGY